ncbi:unnamed protein product [Cuscuta epithymum]|uniref:Uncharacterized protein n=1 Tax=Cuscuta epithymum TaxID=186058 RepID=A0AAV0EFP9_9ASTE|nr:unnamed protein product [Cuscuta epithymum]
MPLVTNSEVKRKQLLHQIRNVHPTNDVTDGNGSGRGVDKIGAGVVTGNINVSVLVGNEPAGEGWEMGECPGEAPLEQGGEVGGGKGRESEEGAFLDVVCGEHGQIGDGEFEVR